jgi:hypothetical protein
MIEIYDQLYFETLRNFELTRCTFKHREMQMNPKYALCNTRELKIWNFVTNVATLYSTAICFIRCFKFKLIAADNQLLLVLFNLLQARFHLQR